MDLKAAADIPGSPPATREEFVSIHSSYRDFLQEDAIARQDFLETLGDTMLKLAFLGTVYGISTFVRGPRAGHKRVSSKPGISESDKQAAKILADRSAATTSMLTSAGLTEEINPADVIEGVYRAPSMQNCARTSPEQVETGACGELRA